MKTILLVRHGSHAEVGRVLSGRSDIALDERGRSQAEALAAALEGVPIASIHSSPRRRTLETAAPIARRRALPVQVAPALDEIDFGAFAGRTFAELDADAAWHRWNRERVTFRCPGGETMAEAADRAAAFLAELPSDATPALCVTHCDVIRGVVARGLELDFGRMFAMDCDPASVTTLAVGDGAIRLVTLNAQP